MIIGDHDPGFAAMQYPFRECEWESLTHRAVANRGSEGLPQIETGRSYSVAEKKTLENVQGRPKRCFVITPIGADGSEERKHADWVLYGAIKPVFESKGYEVFRADTIADPAMINDAIFEHVIEDDVCVADLTFLNANVLYELGVRHALSKPVIHIAADKTPLPFDNAQHRAIFFSRDIFLSFESLKTQLAAHLETIESPGFKVSNPLTHARGRLVVSERADDEDQLLNDALQRIDRLERDLRGVRNQSARTINPPNIFREINTLPLPLKQILSLIIELNSMPDKDRENLDQKILALTSSLSPDEKAFLAMELAIDGRFDRSILGRWGLL